MGVAKYVLASENNLLDVVKRFVLVSATDGFWACIGLSNGNGTVYSHELDTR